MRRWLYLLAFVALGLGVWATAFAAGGRGLFIADDCTTIPSAEVGYTWCFQSKAPFSVQYFGPGSIWSTPTSASGPYTPSTFTTNGVLYGNDVNAIQVTSGGAANSVLAANSGAPFFSSTPTLSALALTTQPALVLNPYGTSTGNTGEIRFLELTTSPGGTDYVGFKAPDSVTTSFVFKLPNTPGTNGQCLVTDGASPTATLSYGACSGGGSGITSLNALVAATQTVTNDTNVGWSSSVSTHTFTWTGTLSVARGGSGAGTFTANGALLGNGTSAFQVTGAGAADTVLRVPGGGGTPAFGAVDVSKAAAITGLVRTANLGSGSPDATTFLRGDQTWAVPSGSSGSSTNYGFNTSFEIWGAGTSTDPTSWTSSSCSGTVKNTTANQFKIGTASWALTRSAGTCLGFQNVATAYGPIGYWANRSIVLGGWVRCTVANRGFLEVNDGVNTTTSTAHSGGSSFEFLSVPVTVAASPTKIEIRAKVSGGSTTCQFDGLILSLGTSVTDWQPESWRGRKAIISLSSGAGTLSSASTSFFGPRFNGTSTSETTFVLAVPFNGVARNLFLSTSATPGGGASYTFIVDKNSTGTPVSCIVTSVSTVCSDTTNEVAFVKNDNITMQAQPAGSPTSTAAGGWVEYEEIP